MEKKSKRERIAWKIYYQRHLVPSEFYSAGSDNAIRTRDQVQVVYMEMTRDGPK